ncbi:hypothetical protein ABIA33_006820 [Streptacidiphilus sp. MAP12-16]|uniref:hypothetical protein n=1 Tax=Streptacidiphilus sp. MAP12-16 TaxID=3156300 RepID=UPI0035154452
MMKSSIGTAVTFLPAGTPGPVAIGWNRSALAAQIAIRARALGLDASLTDDQMNGLAQVVRDSGDGRPLSVSTRAAVRAALREPLTTEDPAAFTAAVFTSLPDTPVPVRATDGRQYMLVAVPVA